MPCEDKISCFAMIKAFSLAPIVLVKLCLGILLWNAMVSMSLIYLQMVSIIYLLLIMELSIVKNAQSIY